VLLESFHEGLDLRILVIGFEVVAAAIRRPAEVVGDGQHSIGALIEAQSRRRQAATGGESKIPLDDETERTLQAAGDYSSSILPAGEHLAVRRTANLHTGGPWKTSPRSCTRCWPMPPCGCAGAGYSGGGPRLDGACRRSTGVRDHRSQ
jgi:D-alanine-D-alanine ligase-like ATP-grasp enzyme